jgi:hypothetical protein
LNPTGSTVSRLIANQGLLLLTIVLVIVFSAVLPNTFPTPLTAQSILSDRSTIAFLALAERRFGQRPSADDTPKSPTPAQGASAS